MTMEETQRIYLRAFGHEWLLPLYDLRRSGWVSSLLDQAGI